MTSPLARRAHNATNALHSLIYFAPETEERLVAAGLEPGRMCYFAGRSAPMGAVGGGVVAATFYNFNPALVARCIPRAWQLASPAAVVSARFAAADAALTRLLGPDVIASADMTRIAGLVREAAGACSVEGRPLYAGHADLDWPSAPHLAAWHGLSLLREHRGDGHVAALVAAGLSGIDALVTHVATGEGFVPGFARASRGWSRPEWDDAVESLVARNLLEGASAPAPEGIGAPVPGGSDVPEGISALTPAGTALRAHVERETDQMAAAPWQHLGGERTEEVIRIGKAMTRAALSAGAFPREGVFAQR
jgi:helix-turn-helix protein